MSLSNRKHLALILGAVGLSVLVAGADASAHGFGGGRMGGFGGGRMGGFGGGRIGFGGGRHDFGGGMGRITPVRFDPGRGGGWHPGPIGIGRGPWHPIHITHRIPIDNPCLIRHSCGPTPPPPPRTPCRFHPDIAFCRGWPPIVVRNPPVLRPPVVVGRAPVASVVMSALSPVAPTPPIAPSCAVPDAPIAVVFQPTATASDITAFLASYNAEIGNGPDKDRVYRVRLEDGHLSADQYAQILQSMRSQTSVVSMVNG